MFFVVHTIVVSYVVYQSREAKVCSCYSPFTLKTHFLTYEIFEFGQPYLHERPVMQCNREGWRKYMVKSVGNTINHDCL